MNATEELLKELRIDRNAKEAPRQVHGKPWGWIIGGVIVVGLALALGPKLFSSATMPEVQTVTAKAFTGPVAGDSVLDASGYVVARRMATVSSKITGKVQDILIEEGMLVEAGQIMATLDPVDAQAQLNLAQAQLRATESAEASIAAQRRHADMEASRLEALVGKGLVSRSQFEAAVASRDALQAQQVTAQRNVKVAQDQVQIALNGIDNTVVRAPFSGVVIAKAAQPGEMVSPMATGGFTRTGIGTVVDMDSLEVEVEVSESFIGRVKPEMPVEVVLNAYPDWRIPAQVIAIIPTADRGKATVKVRVGFKEKDARIVPDMGVRVAFLEADKPRDVVPEGVQVPASAVVTRDGKTWVFILSGNQVAAREVVVGEVMGQSRQVISGLSQNEEVVVNPTSELRDGSKVKTRTGAN